MKLVAGNVEIREVVVLLFDLDVAAGEVAILLFDLSEPLLNTAVLVGQDRVLRSQFLNFFGRAPLTLEGRQPEAETLIFTQQLLGEFAALVEELEELFCFG
jgi:hypothetical protein